MVAVSAWPRCSDPVTLGGGSTMENAGLSLTSSAWKNPCSSHHRAQCGSTRAGSYPLSSSFSTRLSLMARG